jgi:hypothetical protein
LRFAIILALFLCGSIAAAQSSIWQQVSAESHPPKLTSAALSDSQHKAIVSLLRRQSPSGLWNCEGDELEVMLVGLTFETIPLSPGRKVLLVTAGAGCARGGQGSNGAMWLIVLQGGLPVLVASPEDEFSGWLYSIQPTSSHGFHDIVLGWHMSAFEAGLEYFRFDGKSYRPIGSASLLFDGESGKIIPKNVPVSQP